MKTIQAGTVKRQYVGGAYIDAQVLYANEFNNNGFEFAGSTNISGAVDLPDGQYNLYRMGVDRTYRAADSWFLVFSGDRPAEAKKTGKLSKTMQGVMSDIQTADWYYQHKGKGCEYFATEDKVRHIGFESSALVEGGLVYARMSSNTLNALSNRGLVEVKRDGRDLLDVVHVPGMELPERLTKALQVKIARNNSEHPEWRTQYFTCYAVSESAVKHLVNHFATGTHVAEAEVLGEVELGVWDFFANK